MSAPHVHRRNAHGSNLYSRLALITLLASAALLCSCLAYNDMSSGGSSEVVGVSLQMIDADLKAYGSWQKSGSR